MLSLPKDVMLSWERVTYRENWLLAPEKDNPHYMGTLWKGKTGMCYDNGKIGIEEREGKSRGMIWIA